jgi:hypothetical protein
MSDENRGITFIICSACILFALVAGIAVASDTDRNFLSWGVLAASWFIAFPAAQLVGLYWVRKYKQAEAYDDEQTCKLSSELSVVGSFIPLVNASIVVGAVLTFFLDMLIRISFKILEFNMKILDK